MEVKGYDEVYCLETVEGSLAHEKAAANGLFVAFFSEELMGWKSEREEGARASHARARRWRALGRYTCHRWTVSGLAPARQHVWGVVYGDGVQYNVSAPPFCLHSSRITGRGSRESDGRTVAITDADSFFACRFYGFTVYQTHRYFILYPKDLPYVKWLVRCRLYTHTRRTH